MRYSEGAQRKSLENLEKVSPGRKVVIQLEPDNKKTLGALIFSGPVTYLPGRQYEIRETQLSFLERSGVKYKIVRDYGKQK